MNIAWQRLIDGMLKTLDSKVLPALADPYARGQVYGVMGVLSQMRVGAEWREQPLREQLAAQQALFGRVQEAAAALGLQLPVAPEPQQPAPGADLWALRDAADQRICALLDRLAAQPPSDAVQRLQAMIYEQMQAQLAIEVRYVVKPEFAQVTSGES